MTGILGFDPFAPASDDQQGCELSQLSQSFAGASRPLARPEVEPAIGGLLGFDPLQQIASAEDSQLSQLSQGSPAENDIACPYCGVAGGDSDKAVVDGAPTHRTGLNRWLGMTPTQLVAPMLSDAERADVRLGLDNAGDLLVEAPDNAPTELVAELQDWAPILAAVLRWRDRR